MTACWGFLSSRLSALTDLQRPHKACVCGVTAQNSGRQVLFAREPLCLAAGLSVPKRSTIRMMRQRHTTAAQRHASGSSPPVDKASGPAEVVGQLADLASETALQAQQQPGSLIHAAEQQRHHNLERRARRSREQLTYQIAAITASLGVTVLGVLAVHYRFAWHHHGPDFPTVEALSTLLLVFGGVIGMEMWARWAHKALWHDFQPGWGLHKSHHEKRVGPFEANDIFAVINAVPAMGLCAYGFLTPGQFGGVCFGAGLGITIFGICYMFIHDGLVHKRFPTGPIAQVPYLKRVAAAHKLHHAEKYGGVPWGLFLGPQELEAVGAKGDLDRLCTEQERQESMGRQFVP